MKSSNGILKGIIAFVIIVAIGIGLGWLASRHKTTPPTPPPTQATITTPTVAPKPVIPMVAQSMETNEVSTAEPEPEPADLADKISDILADDTEITNKVEELLKLYPKLTPEGKLEAIEHLTNLVGDEDNEYAPLGKILTSPDVPPKVAAALLDDLINRPPELLMHYYLQVVCDLNNPQNKQARDTLETYVDQDYGDDCAQWTKAVNDWLKENADASTPAPAVQN